MGDARPSIALLARAATWLVLVLPCGRKVKAWEGGHGCGEGQLADHSRGYDPDSMNSGNFLSVARISEQLTKARLHLAELMALSRRSNRTLVLPPGSQSRIAPEARNLSASLCAYFDLEAIGAYVAWVSESYFFEKIVGSDFEKWNGLAVFVQKRNSSCTTSIPACAAAGECPGEPPPPAALPTGTGTGTTAIALGGWGAMPMPMPMPMPRSRLCLANCPPRQAERSAEQEIAQVGRPFNILVFSRASPHSCLPMKEIDDVLHVMPYAKHLQIITKKFVEKKLKKSFLAIHWRMEKFLGGRFSQRQLLICTKTLIKKSKKIVKDFHLSHVFIATDFTPDDIILSDSLSRLAGEQREWLLKAIKRVHLSLRPVAWPAAAHHRRDSGVKGILDKLVSGQAQKFLYPSARCSGRHSGLFSSSFTREIIHLRNANNFPPESSEDWEDGYNETLHKKRFGSFRFGHWREGEAR